MRNPKHDMRPFEESNYNHPEDTISHSVCDGCPGCIIYCRLMPLPVNEMDAFQLIHDLTEEIVLLEEELIRWRHALIKYLPVRWADGLRQDIFDNQSRRFYGDSELYDRFVDEYCAGVDPLESDDHVERMLRLRDGTDEISIDYL